MTIRYYLPAASAGPAHIILCHPEGREDNPEDATLCGRQHREWRWLDEKAVGETGICRACERASARLKERG